QKRRRLEVGVAIGDREAVPLIGDGQLCVAAIQLVAGEPRALAEDLPARAAIRTDAGGPTEPRNAPPLARPKALGPLPRSLDRTDDLMSRNEGQLGLVEVAVAHVGAGPAHTACVHSQ